MKPTTLVWAILTIFMVMIAFFVGLRPKGGSSANDARWIAEQGGLRFQGQGMAFAENVCPVTNACREAPFTIEMAVTPTRGRLRGYHPLMVMHSGHDHDQMTIWQYDQSLIVMNGDDYDNRKRRARVVARDIFARQKTRFVTVVSGPRGTRLHVDGDKVAAKRDMHLTLPHRGSKLLLVLGNSVYANHGWRGDIHGMAVTGIALDEEAVKRRHLSWRAERSFDFVGANSQMLRFNANAGEPGRSVQLPSNQSLRIPERLVALEKRFLEMPWASMKWDRKAVLDIVINIIGFIPIGMVSYGFFHSLAGLSGRQGQAFAILLCLMLSLLIELTQAFIPSRISSFRDLLLNTFGAWVGVAVWRVGGSRSISDKWKRN